MWPIHKSDDVRDRHDELACCGSRRLPHLMVSRVPPPCRPQSLLLLPHWRLHATVGPVCRERTSSLLKIYICSRPFSFLLDAPFRVAPILLFNKFLSLPCLILIKRNGWHTVCLCIFINSITLQIDATPGVLGFWGFGVVVVYYEMVCKWLLNCF